ncbi:polyphosphate kinase 2 family protein [Altericroceibacterium xinjiangense]|uniref:polyphosphate kinase 2 family protein n=1 Tax=Altericroceibacterium xinjiangense TaxID=762261 RepID=UPI000F7DD4B8|nr:polyphosphate kinase [Altericroceibacterium xinjiangense]
MTNTPIPAAESSHSPLPVTRLARHEAPEPLDRPYDEALEELQKKLAAVMVGHIVHKKRSVIVFEGWDAAGKGGAIKRLTAEWDPRAFSVWPISAPTEEEKAHNFLWRFWTRLPATGEIAVFDRSWYGRVLVERVEGFASEAEWRRAYDEINQFEAQLAADGTTVVKLFLHVSVEEQDERLKARLAHPWKRWKVSPEDFRNRERRAGYLAAMEEMFDRTDTAVAPWIIINGDKKKSARIAVLQAVYDCLAPVTPSEPPQASDEVMRLARSAFG